MQVRITRPHHTGVDRSQALKLILASLVLPFQMTGSSRLLGGFLLWSAIFAVLVR